MIGWDDVLGCVPLAILWGVKCREANDRRLPNVGHCRVGLSHDFEERAGRAAGQRYVDALRLGAEAVSKSERRLSRRLATRDGRLLGKSSARVVGVT